MAKNKQVGTERPWTPREFMRMIENEANEQKVPYLDHLDYVLGEHDEHIMAPHNYPEITSLTHWGGSEGIYTGFYIRNYDGEDVQIGTMKTLGGSDYDYIAMHTLAGYMCVIANRYIDSHQDEFQWYGYDVRYMDIYGNNCGYCGFHTFEDAEQRAKELKAKGMKNVTVRNNETRKIEVNYV